MTAQGWECPRCGAINAPWAMQCSCSRKGVSGTGTCGGNITINADIDPGLYSLFGQAPPWNSEE